MVRGQAIGRAYTRYTQSAFPPWAQGIIVASWRLDKLTATRPQKNQEEPFPYTGGGRCGGRMSRQKCVNETEEDP
jgi:hypothetical protein